jgi:hypothetical protein
MKLSSSKEGVGQFKKQMLKYQYEFLKSRKKASPIRFGRITTNIRMNESLGSLDIMPKNARKLQRKTGELSAYQHGPGFKSKSNLKTDLFALKRGTLGGTKFHSNSSRELIPSARSFSKKVTNQFGLKPSQEASHREFRKLQKSEKYSSDVDGLNLEPSSYKF